MKRTQTTSKHIFNSEFNNLSYTSVRAEKCFHCSHFAVVPKEKQNKTKQLHTTNKMTQIILQGFRPWLLVKQFTDAYYHFRLLEKNYFCISEVTLLKEQMFIQIQCYYQ